MTPQEKIDKIYEMLSAHNRRERHRMIFAWIYRGTIFVIIVLILFFPGFLLGQIYKIIKPIVQIAAEEVIEAQKQNISNFSQKALDRVKQVIQ